MTATRFHGDYMPVVQQEQPTQASAREDEQGMLGARLNKAAEVGKEDKN